MKHLYLLLLLCSVGLLFAADRGQKTEPHPNKPLSKSEVLKLTGDWKGSKLSRDIRILWLYGPEDHGGGEGLAHHVELQCSHQRLRESTALGACVGAPGRVQDLGDTGYYQL